jgi:hypothetical protein
MAISGLSVAYATAGGLIMWSGVKGDTIAQTVKSVLSGSVPATGTQTIGSPSVGLSSSAPATTASSSGNGESVSESAWISAFLSALGAPATSANTASMTDWISQEGTFGSGATNNPLNTTEPGFGSTSVFNSDNVRNYPTEQDGISATVATLNNGDYPDILSLLHSGAGLKSGASAGLSKWSKGAYTSV